MLTKSCQRCGRRISTDDWYSYIRTKYCPSCAADVHREQKANYAKELRRKTREQNALTRQLCKEQQQELETLRQLLAAQRDRNRVLSAELEEAKHR